MCNLLTEEIIGTMMEHPPVSGGTAGSTLPQGREPSDVQPPRDPRFQGMSIPGYNMKLGDRLDCFQVFDAYSFRVDCRLVMCSLFF